MDKQLGMMAPMSMAVPDIETIFKADPETSIETTITNGIRSIFLHYANNTGSSQLVTRSSICSALSALRGLDLTFIASSTGVQTEQKPHNKRKKYLARDRLWTSTNLADDVEAAKPSSQVCYFNVSQGEKMQHGLVEFLIRPEPQRSRVTHDALFMPLAELATLKKKGKNTTKYPTGLVHRAIHDMVIAAEVDEIACVTLVGIHYTVMKMEDVVGGVDEVMPAMQQGLLMELKKKYETTEQEDLSLVA